MAGVQLTDLAPQRLVAVHDALGIARGTRGEGDQRRLRRVRVHGAPHGLVGEQIVEIASDAVRRSARRRHRSGWICHSPELLGGDEHLRSGGRQDVADFLSAVEVHDRNHDGAEQGRGPERRGRFHPVGQLERDDVTGAHPAGLQTSGQPPRDSLDVAERPGVRPDGRVHPKRRVWLCVQRIGQQCAQRVGRPPALGFVAVPQLGADRTTGDHVDQASSLDCIRLINTEFTVERASCLNKCEAILLRGDQ